MASYNELVRIAVVNATRGMVYLSKNNQPIYQFMIGETVSLLQESMTKQKEERVISLCEEPLRVMIKAASPSLVLPLAHASDDEEKLATLLSISEVNIELWEDVLAHFVGANQEVADISTTQPDLLAELGYDGLQDGKTTEA